LKKYIELCNTLAVTKIAKPEVHTNTVALQYTVAVMYTCTTEK